MSQPINIQLYSPDGPVLEGYRIKISSTGALGGGIEREYTVSYNGYVQLPAEWRERDVNSLWCYDSGGNLKYRLESTVYIPRDKNETVSVHLKRA